MGETPLDGKKRLLWASCVTVAIGRNLGISKILQFVLWVQASQKTNEIGGLSSILGTCNREF
jgi:hypothetical protein